MLVGANAGLVGMVKEHLGIALALKIPAFFVITKIDMAPEHILKQTVLELTTVLKKPGVRKRPFIVRNDADVLIASRSVAADSVVRPHSTTFLNSLFVCHFNVMLFSNRVFLLPAPSALSPACRSGHAQRRSCASRTGQPALCAAAGARMRMPPTIHALHAHTPFWLCCCCCCRCCCCSCCHCHCC